MREEEFEQVGEQFAERVGGGIDGKEVADQAIEEYVGNDNLFSQLEKVGNFTFKQFESKDELDAYIASDKIGRDPDFEAVCFGFSINENEDQNKYDLDLYFNDMWPGWLNAIPSQKRPIWTSYEYTPMIEDYLAYT